MAGVEPLSTGHRKRN